MSVKGACIRYARDGDGYGAVIVHGEQIGWVYQDEGSWMAEVGPALPGWRSTINLGGFSGCTAAVDAIKRFLSEHIVYAAVVEDG